MMTAAFSSWHSVFVTKSWEKTWDYWGFEQYAVS